MSHVSRRIANDAVEGEEQCGQDEDDHQNADDGASCHKHAHGTDDVNVGVKGNAEGCGEESHAGYDNRGNGRLQGRENGCLLCLPGDSLCLVSRGHQDGVVYRGA